MTKDGEVRHYVNLLTNSGFKAVFGDRANKDVVISVINALLPAHRQVTDIDYGPTEHQGGSCITRSSVMISCARMRTV